ncbi:MULTISPECIES: hypothetical protein [Brevibacterium]|nr:MULTISPECIES: hypothetical protein [Brevibacterium]MDN5588377.1 hypothetical protein [Brevibacterium sp.]
MDIITRVRRRFGWLRGATPAEVGMLASAAVLGAATLCLLPQSLLILTGKAEKLSGPGLELPFALGAGGVAVGLFVVSRYIRRRRGAVARGSLARGFGLAGGLLLASIALAVLSWFGGSGGGVMHWLSVVALYTGMPVLVATLIVLVSCVVIAAVRGANRASLDT